MKSVNETDKKDNINEEEDEDDEEEEYKPEECFLYDLNSKPTFIERLFGEPYHVKDKYPAHQITVRFILVLAAVYVVEGCIDWVLIATRYFGASVWEIGPAEMVCFLKRLVCVSKIIVIITFISILFVII